MKKKINKYVFFISVVILVIGFLSIKIKNSLFITRPDRLNLVFYGQNVVFYSLDFENKIHYRINLSSEVRLSVPGGYGEYRIGSLGKLIKLEKKPQLLQKAFSAALSNFTHNYFFPDNDVIYQHKNANNDSLPSIQDLLVYKSNAKLFDRLYLFIIFFIQGREINQNIASIVVTNKQNDQVWQREDFSRKYLGYWYSKDIRSERANVQIIYKKNYNTAQLLSNVIEGNGIKIVDLTENSQMKSGRCLIEYNSIKMIKTVSALTNFFQCDQRLVQTDAVDIMIYLNNLETEWEIN